MQKTTTPGLAILVFFISIASAKGQNYYYNYYYDRPVHFEVGASAGMMNAMTDVGGKKGIGPNSKAAQFNGSFYVGAMFRDVFGLRVEATWGSIAGADSNGLHKKRNLSFKTPIREIALIGEFHPTMLKYYDEIPLYSPYVVLGAGWFSFNPRANLGGNWVDLQPLRTEGQGFPQRPGTRPYDLSGFNFMGGLGLKYDISHVVTARAELLLRHTFTDYLDDASTIYVDPDWFDANLHPAKAALARQLYDRSNEKDPLYSGPYAIRSNPKTNDHYLTFNFKLGINLGR